MLNEPNIPREAELPEVNFWENGDETTIDPVVKRDLLREETSPEIEAEEI